MSIYTRTGDKGETSLYNGERRKKNNIIFDVLGNLDELNSYIGLVQAKLLQNNIKDFTDFIAQTQHILLDIGSYIATPRTKTKSTRKLKRTEITEEYTEIIETYINRMDEYLPKLTAFILPSGSETVCSIHVCRAICRRTERSIISLDSEDVNDNIMSYINRLSDFLFVLARYVCHKENTAENTHKK